MKFFVTILTIITVCGASAVHGAVEIAADGKTAYSIAAPTDPGPSMRKALNDLSLCLKEATGADFAERAEGEKRILIGVPVPGRKALQPFERVVCSFGGDIYLYGSSEEDHVFAIYDFLDKVIGCRWYTAFGDKKIPRYDRLAVPDFDYTIMPSFKSRQLCNHHWLKYDIKSAEDFFRRNRIDHRNCHSIKIIGPGAHTLSRYVPPGIKVHQIGAPVRAARDKKYFLTNPEFFSLMQDGKRSPESQLCLSNPELRRVLTENIEKTIALEKAADLKGVVSVDANDRGANFCYCSNCKKLEQKYGSPGGPLYDYLLELAALFKQKYPKLMIRFLAYKPGQTEQAPKGVKFPGNLIPFFAPITGDFGQSFTAASNKRIYDNFNNWSEVADSMWLWYYPNTYPRPAANYPLAANIQRLVEDIRTAHKLNVRMYYAEHDCGVPGSLAASDLQLWLLARLVNDIGEDHVALTREFTGYYYGGAADSMLKYFKELETLQAAETRFMRWNPDQRVLSYVTPANVLRWQKEFDRMENEAAANPDHLNRVRFARMNLDMNTLQIWPAILRENPGFEPSPELFYRRFIRNMDLMFAVNFKGAAEKAKNEYREHLLSGIDQFMALAKGGKPLPFLKNAAPETVFQALPAVNKSRVPEEAEAAFGIAVSAPLPEKEAKYIVWDFTESKRLSRDTLISRQTFEKAAPGYNLYKLGNIALTYDCQIVLPTDIPQNGRACSIFLGHIFDSGKPDARFDIYLSMKYDKDGKRIYTDRAVLVKTRDGKDAENREKNEDNLFFEID